MPITHSFWQILPNTVDYRWIKNLSVRLPLLVVTRNAPHSRDQQHCLHLSPFHPLLTPLTAFPSPVQQLVSYSCWPTPAPILCFLILLHTARNSYHWWHRRSWWKERINRNTQTTFMKLRIIVVYPPHTFHKWPVFLMLWCIRQLTTRYFWRGK